VSLHYTIIVNVVKRLLVKLYAELS